MGGVDAVVFDLGGVLAAFAGVERMRALSGLDSDEELWRRWLTCDWVRRFERGQCSSEEFAAGVVTDWQLPIGADGFLEEFRGWLVGPLPGAEDLVRDVARHAAIACLSNTNPVHVEAGAGRWPLLSMFDQTFLSYELGMVKPDPEIFQHVVTAVGCPPERVLYLDDNQLNVDGARSVGLRAVRAVGVDQARNAVAAAGVFAC